MAAPVGFWECLKQEGRNPVLKGHNPTGISSLPYGSHLVLVGQKTRLDHLRTGFCFFSTTHLKQVTGDPLMIVLKR